MPFPDNLYALSHELSSYQRPQSAKDVDQSMPRLDDMQDCSCLRRGRPSSHTVFGLAWTMNSADYGFVAALQELQKLDNTKCLSVFIGRFRCPRVPSTDLTGSVEELRYMYIGQSYDLYWTRNVSCPSVEDYLRMVDQSLSAHLLLL